MNWPGEPSNCGLNQGHAPGILLAREELVDELGEARPPLGRIVRLLRLDSEKMRSADARHMIGKLRKSAGLPQQLHALFGDRMEFVYQNRSMAIYAGNLFLKHAET